MSGQSLLLLALAVAVLGALLSGIPVYLAIGGISLAAAAAGAALGVFDANLLYAFPVRVFGVAENGVLPAIPFFVLMGSILDRSGIAASMLRAMAAAAKGSSRGLALGALLVGVLIAASTHVVGATLILLAVIAMPGLERAKVKQVKAAGLLMATGTLGQILPPSILLVLLSDQISNAWVDSQRTTGNFSASPVSMTDLFAAALVPSLLLIGLYAAWVTATFPANRDKSKLKPDRAAFHTGAFLAPVVLIALVLGSILFGIATPTESACLGSAGAILLAIAAGGNGALSTLRLALADAVRLSGVIFSIVIAASVLSLVFRGLGGDELVLGLLPADRSSANFALAAVMAAIFLLGFVMEFVEIVYIVIPVAAPALFAAGIDPLWFATLVALNLQTSFLTPPFGLSLFYFRSAAPQVPTAVLIRAVIPYVCLQLVALGLVAAFPALATWLPGLLN